MMIRSMAIFFVLVLVMFGCAPHFQKPQITDQNQLALPEPIAKGIPALKFHNGILEDFSYENSRWSTWSEKLILTWVKGSMKIEAKEAGPDYSNVNFRFPLLDFSKSPVIRITARSEANSKPVLKIVLKDIYGNEANELIKSDTVIGTGWKDYFFNFKNKWIQNWPKKEKVDSSAIAEMLIYINSGGPAFTGIIFIDEVAVVNEEDAPKEVVLSSSKKTDEEIKNESLDSIQEPNFFYSPRQNLESWWNDKKINLAKKDSVMIITAYDVGPKYEVLGKSFKAMNFTKTGVIRILARAESESMPHIQLSLTDKKGRGANFNPDTAIISTDNNYKNYYFNFNKKYKQIWPDTLPVDPTQIASLLIFINSGKKPYTGKIYIKEVALIDQTDIPDEEIERIELLKKMRSAAKVPIIEKPLETALLFNPQDSLASWWCDKKMIMIKKDNDLMIMGSGIGPKYEAFGKTFKPMNFSKSGVIRIRARAESTVMPLLSMSISDKDGHGANFNPQTEKITTGKNYKDYFYNFKGKYKQVWPDTAKVNPHEINSLILFINAGKKPFTGKLYINEVEVMTEESMKKMVLDKKE